MDIDKQNKRKGTQSYKDIIKISNALQDHVVKCKCSHSILFTGRKDRIICSHCGHYVYQDKKAELKYKMKELLK